MNLPESEDFLHKYNWASLYTFTLNQAIILNFFMNIITNKSTIDGYPSFIFCLLERLFGICVLL